MIEQFKKGDRVNVIGMERASHGTVCHVRDDGRGVALYTVEMDSIYSTENGFFYARDFELEAYHDGEIQGLQGKEV